MSFFFLTPGVAKVVDLESFWHFAQTILFLISCVWMQELVHQLIDEAECLSLSVEAMTKVRVPAKPKDNQRCLETPHNKLNQWLKSIFVPVSKFWMSLQSESTYIQYLAVVQYFDKPHLRRVC